MNERMIPLRTVLICFCIISSCLAFSQNQPVIDSLLNVLDTKISDRERVDIYVKVADQYSRSDSLNFANYTQNAIELASKINYKEGLVDANFLRAWEMLMKGNMAEADTLFDHILQVSLSVNYQNGLARVFNGLGVKEVLMGKHEKALGFWLKSLEIHEKSGDKSGLATLYGNIGNVYEVQGNYERALDLQFKSLQTKEELGYTSGIAKSYNNIGKIYTSKGDYEKALDFCFKAFKIQEDLGDKTGLANTCNNIGNLYEMLGNYEKALNYCLKSLQIREISGDLIGMASSHNNISKIYYSKGDYEKALESSFKALSISGEMEYRATTTTSIELLGQIYYKLGKNLLAKNYLDSALDLSRQIGNVHYIKSIAETLSLVEQDLGNFQAAYEYHVLFKKMADSLQNEELAKKIMRLEANYEFEQERDSIQNANTQEKLILSQEIQRRRTTQYLTLVGAFALLIISFILYRYYRSRQKANKLLSRQKKELEELDEFKSRFFTNISHELRTPLTLISSPLKNLLQKDKERIPPDAMNTLQLIKRNTENLKGLVNDILDLSKLESGKLKFIEEPVQMIDFHGRIAANYLSMADHLAIEFGQSYEETLDEWLLLDPGRLEKVLNNLLFNAIKYTSEGGEICLEAFHEQKLLKISVSDTGQGIAATDLPHVFERYFQSKQPDAPIQGGTGIGLALAYELALLMGGDLTVESELGKGSTFTLCIPYQPTSAPATADILPNETGDFSENGEGVLLYDSFSSATHGQPKVLVVEDNLDMQAYVSKLLSPTYQVALAINGKKALEKLEQEDFDLIISDAMMPEMDGFTLLQNLKDSENHWNIPFIMLTALNFEESKLQALSIGVDDYLTKPFSPQELIVRAQNLVTRYHARKDWMKHEEKQGSSSDEKFKDSTLINKSDLEWLKSVEQHIKKELENDDFHISDLAKHFNLSSRQFQRRIKKVTGMSPKQYEQEIALQKARELLESGSVANVTAAAYSIGFNNPSRFSTAYYERFGKKPSAYFREVLLDQ